MRQDEVSVGQAQDFLVRYTNTSAQAEVRFQLASGLKKLGRNNEALEEVMRLLQSQQRLAQEHPETLAYWQQRAGNEIANQLYQEGDFVHALDIYQSLLLLSPATDWQCPVLYQIGLIYERLEQPGKAAESYSAILARQRNELLPRLVQSLAALGCVREAWQRLDGAARARQTGVEALLRRNQDLIMKVIVLDRENEQALLRRGLLPPSQLPSSCRQRPYTVAAHYLKNVA